MQLDKARFSTHFICLHENYIYPLSHVLVSSTCRKPQFWSSDWWGPGMPRQHLVIFHSKDDSKELKERKQRLCLTSKSTKKLLQNHLSETSEQIVLLKDLHNVAVSSKDNKSSDRRGCGRTKESSRYYESQQENICKCICVVVIIPPPPPPHTHTQLCTPKNSKATQIKY